MKFHPLSQKQIVVSAGAILVVGMIGVMWGADQRPVQPHAMDVSRINAERVSSLNAIATGTDHSLKSTFTSVGLPVVASAPSAELANKEPMQLWSAADLKAASPSIQLNERVVEYQAMQVESRWGHAPNPGQLVVMPLLHGETISVQVETVHTLSNGDISWSGHYLVDGDAYPVVMTLGDHSSFATITTPKGSYTLEALNGSGWLYKNPAEVELSNPGANDYLDVTNP